MHHLTRIVRCGAGAAVIGLAGCSGAGGAITTPVTGNAAQLSSTDLIRKEFPLFAMQASRKPVKAFVNAAGLAKQATTIAVSNALDDVISVYDPAGNELAELGGLSGPEGLASDGKGDLYVADSHNERVQVFPAGFATAPATLGTPGYFPVAVDSFNDGQIVAVAGFAPNALPNVEFFTNGRLTNTIVSPFVPLIRSCAFDAVGNLYLVMGDSQSNGIVGEIVGGAHGTQLSQLSTPNVIYAPSGIAVTSNGQIAIGVTSGFDAGQSHTTVYTYDPPVAGALGSPVTKTLLTGSAFPVGFAFANDMSSLYAANFDSGQVQEFDYPAGGSAPFTIDVGGVPYGIAVMPKEFPKAQK